MKLVLFANGCLGLEIFRGLLEQKQKPMLLVLNRSAKQSYAEELRKLAEDNNIPTTEDDELSAQQLTALAPDWGLSVTYGHILKAQLIDCFSNGIVNLHNSLLPANRGANPNVWPLIDGSPAGVSIHRIDAGVDTGPIYAQRPVDVRPEDNAKDLYERLNKAVLLLFWEVWPQILGGQCEALENPSGGTTHRVADFHAMRKLDMDSTIRVGDLINLLRACSFPPFAGATFERDGRQYSLRISIEPLD